MGALNAVHVGQSPSIGIAAPGLHDGFQGITLVIFAVSARLNSLAGGQPGNGAFWYKGQPLTAADIRDGLSNTIFVGEKHVPRYAFGESPDSSIFNGDHDGGMRKAGVGAPLAPTFCSSDSKVTL